MILSLKPLGFAFPPDPASGKVATLNGNVATNAGGVKGVKYGTTRNYVLGLEVVEYNCIRAINQNTDLTLPEVAAILLAESDEEARALWLARKSTCPVIARLDNTVISGDTTVPISKVADRLEVIADVAKKYDIIIPTVGHVADGSLHPHFSYDCTDPDESKRVKHAKEELNRRAIELGGTLTGEHGIGMGKAPYMCLEPSDAAMGIMRKIKQALETLKIF